MSDPRYFTAPDGLTYRVLDMRQRNGKRILANPPATWASTRIFRAADGRERFVSLGVLELHPEWGVEPTDEMLALLFGRSERGRGWPGRTLAERAADVTATPAPPASPPRVRRQ